MNTSSRNGQKQDHKKLSAEMSSKILCNLLVENIRYSPHKKNKIPKKEKENHKIEEITKKIGENISLNKDKDKPSSSNKEDKIIRNLIFLVNKSVNKKYCNIKKITEEIGKYQLKKRKNYISHLDLSERTRKTENFSFKKEKIMNPSNILMKLKNNNNKMKVNKEFIQNITDENNKYNGKESNNNK